MLDLVTTAQFRKDLKRLRKRGAYIRKLDGALKILCAEKPLPERYRDHALVGDYIGFRECHISPDWLLVYAVDKGKLILTASRTGSHADLFQPILWDRLFLLVFCTDALHMTSFHHRTQERPLLPCSTRMQRRALFIVFCYAVSIFPWKSSRASGLMVM